MERTHRIVSWPALLVTALFLLLVASLTVHVPQAHADGDPASDGLQYADLWPSRSFPAKSADINALTSQLAKANNGKKQIKVTVIATASADLGTVAVLFGKPQTYANFLASEIQYFCTCSLVVVMPQGVGVAPVPRDSKIAKAMVAKARKKIAHYDVKVPKNASLHDLAVTASKAVAAVTGVPVPKALAHTSTSKKNYVLWIIIAIIVVLILISDALFMTMRRRRKRAAAAQSADTSAAGSAPPDTDAGSAED